MSDNQVEFTMVPSEDKFTQSIDLENRRTMFRIGSRLD